MKGKHLARYIHCKNNNQPNFTLYKHTFLHWYIGMVNNHPRPASVFIGMANKQYSNKNYNNIHWRESLMLYRTL